MSAPIPQWFIDELLQRCDLIEILRARLNLKHSGHNYMALCPFHQEKTPSFTANANKQFYHCFGCGASGNVIHFLMNYDRMTFPEAIEYLAQHTGMELPEDNRQSHQHHDKTPLYTSLEQAANLYKQQLKHNQEAIAYFKSRGISGDTAHRYHLGYAPAQWQFICEQLGRDASTLQYLVKCGLINSKNQRYYDRFRHRIMFPIRNIRGKTVGFGGRSIDNSEPKYLNSPESSVFHKKYELYGLYEARRWSDSLEQLFVVEGYMDVIALAEHGIHNAVGTLGTAITGAHVQKLLRYTSEIIYCFDGDEAGQRAAWRALEVTLPYLHEKAQVRFLFLPQGEDPDSYVMNHGSDYFLHTAQQAETLTDYFFQSLQQHANLATIEGRAQLARQALNHINQMPTGIFQHLLYQRLSELIRVPIDELQHFIEKRTNQSTSHPSTPKTHRLSPQEQTLALILQHPEQAYAFKPELESLEPQSHRLKIIKQMLEILQKNPKINTGTLLSYWTDPKAQQYLARLASYPLAVPQEGAYEELKAKIHQLKSQMREQQIARLMDQYHRHGLDAKQKQHLQQLLQQRAEDT